MLFILIICAIFAFLTWRQWKAIERLPRGPAPLLLIGNLHQLAFSCWKHGGTVPGLNAFKKQYGKVFTIWMGPLPTVHIADYDVAYETHVKRANTFSHRFTNGIFNHIREGRGIIGSNGEFWQEHRRFALHTLRNFGLGRNIMEERIMEEYRYRFEDFKKSNFKNGGIEVNASNCFDLLVGSIINTLLVSERFERDDVEFKMLKMNLAKALEKVSFVEAFCPTWLLKSSLWSWRTQPIFEPLNFIHSLVQRKIRKRVSKIESGNHVVSEDGDDFVDAFLIKMEKDKKTGLDSTFNLETLAIDMYDLWLAGQETTSTTLTWACACLLNHPEVVEELRRELVQVTGGNRSVSLTDRTETPYLNATINEIQRIASILNNNLLRVLEQDTLIDGQPISAGTAFTTQLSMLHTDEIIFKNPSEFNPNRFLENNNLEKTLIPFGIGKRSCLGESLARAELYLIIGNMVLEYNLEPVGTKPEIKSPTAFGLAHRPPSYQIRFVPIVK